MKSKSTKKVAPQKAENKADLKKQTVKKDDVKKGYNEKNPLQPQGAFKPDNSTENN